MKPLTLFTNSNLYFFFDINDVLFVTNLSQNLTKKNAIDVDKIFHLQNIPPNVYVVYSCMKMQCRSLQ